MWNYIKKIYQAIGTPFRWFFSQDDWVKLACFMLFIFIGWRIFHARTFGTDLPHDWKVALIDTTTLRIQPKGGMTDSVKLRNIRLRRGDSLRVLGLRNATAEFWVETTRGDRGFIPAEAVERRWMVIERDDSLLIGDTLNFVRRSKKYPGDIEFTDAAGRELRTDDDTAVPLQLAEQDRLQYGVELHKARFSSQNKFAASISGRTLAEVDSMFTPATYVARHGKKTYAHYDMGVFSPEAGFCFRPVLVFEEGKPTLIKMSLDDQRDLRRGDVRNTWMLKNLPGGSAIIDALGWAIDDGRYFDLSKEMMLKGIQNSDSLAVKCIAIPIAAIVGIFIAIAGLAFYYYVPILLFIFMRALLQNPWPLKPLNNWMAFILSMAVGLGGIYAWWILIMQYNAIWWIVLPVTLYYAAKQTYWLLDLLSERCHVCRHINSYVFDHRQYGQEKIEWRSEAKHTHLGTDRSTRGWGRWEDVKDKYGNVERKYIHDEEKTVTRSRTDNYKVLYTVKPYINHYKCKYCGAMEAYQGEELEEMQRKYAGSTISTSTSTTTYGKQ